MPDRLSDGEIPRGGKLIGEPALWGTGIWILPLITIALWAKPSAELARVITVAAAVLLAPLPALIWSYLQRRRFLESIAAAREEGAQLRLQLETVRHRTSRLREELQAADKQARLSHQLTLLGQFTAGFMHEFNNPLAIVAGRLEVLLEERRNDRALCADIEQMLKETRYMGRIAGTLLQALRRERGGEVFEPCDPRVALEDAVAAVRPAPKAQQVALIEEIGEAPRIDAPEHVIGEVVRGLLTNALAALEGRDQSIVWVRLEPYRTAGAKVVIRIEDNGPGVPEAIRTHLFEPFVAQSGGRERLGLGLFLAASLLDMYDGRIRYATREGGGASFIMELPPARFTRGQPYHWFSGGTTE
jgi:two-component system C4-dicarboxylate transport sensor histidine kinase DctB